MSWIGRFRLSALACIGCIAALSLAGCEQERDGLSLLDAAPLTLPEPEGRWLVINYWAEWCKPCRHEIPELNRLALESGDKVLVLGVNFDGLHGDALRAAKQHFAITFDLFTEDPRAVFALERPSAIPVTYLVNPQGEVAAQLVGPQTKLAVLAKIERLQKSENDL